MKEKRVIFPDDDIPFGPGSNFKERKWQIECLIAYKEAVKGLAPPSVGRRPLVFMLNAGVGAGKTSMAALVASQVLNMRKVERVVYVAPNRAIIKRVRREFARFRIDLVHWSNKRGHDGEPPSSQGLVMTYGALARRPDIQRRLCRDRETLVIFDEIHHLGDSLAWHDSALEAFGPAALVFGMTGTPYRSDNKAMPFVTYEAIPLSDGTLKFRADYTYKLGRAISEGVCRKPGFEFLGGDVELTSASGEVSVVSFNEDKSTETQNLRLAGAVRPGSLSRAVLLRFAVDWCRNEGRKLIIFVGGDSTSDVGAIDDAENHLPLELLELGLAPEDFVTVTSNDREAMSKIDAFGASKAWVLVTVNMVSEGVDIPELSAALFLTSITSRATTHQRIGRVLRMRGLHDPVVNAVVFMFSDPRYVEIAKQIEAEITHEIKVQAEKASRSEFARHADPDRPKAHAVGLSAYPDGFVFEGRHFPQDQVEFVLNHLASIHTPPTIASIAMALTICFPAKSKGDAA